MLVNLRWRRIAAPIFMVGTAITLDKSCQNNMKTELMYASSPAALVVTLLSNTALCIARKQVNEDQQHFVLSISSTTASNRMRLEVKY